MQRRGFIKVTMVFSGMALGGWIPAGMAARPAAKAPLVPLGEGFSYDKLKAYIGETFQVYGGPGLRIVVNLKLVGVDRPRRSKETEQFVARFQGSGDDRLEGGVYQFQHSTAGEFRLLIAPTISDGQSQYYRADFNLLR